jgi:hypothetical protein
MIIAAQAKYEALEGAAEALRDAGYSPDPSDYPRDADRRKIARAFEAVVLDLEKKAAKQLDLLRRKGIEL